MISSIEQAFAVQGRRRMSGKKGRSKAVRRWFKRQGWRAVEAYGGHPPGCPMDWRERLSGDFSGCRGWTETHQSHGRLYRKGQEVGKVTDFHVSVSLPDEFHRVEILNGVWETFETVGTRRPRLPGGND